MKYRNNIQITADLLNAVQQCGMDGIKTTVLMQKGNLSHSRLQTFVYNLTSSGLLNEIKYDGKNFVVITEKGRIFLTEYSKFHDFANSFGLEI